VVFARWGIGLNAFPDLVFFKFLDKRIIDYDGDDDDDEDYDDDDYDENNNNYNNNNKRIMMATDHSKSHYLSICNTSTSVLTE
jgi:hypothetical protein